MARQPDIPVQPFPSTHWSLIDRARQPDQDARQDALGVLWKCYAPALRAHLTVEKRIPPEQAEDFLQGFVADKIIEQNLLGNVHRAKGKFRSFLLVTLNHYVASQFRSEAAAKRQPAGGLSGLDAGMHEISGGDDPAQAFNQAWARELIQEALRRMQAECAQSGRGDLWTIFHGRVAAPALEGQPPAGYAQLVQELGLASPLEACALLTTGKRMFLRNVRAAAAEYADGDGDGGADAEIADLRKILADAGARNGRPLRN